MFQDEMDIAESNRNLRLIAERFAENPDLSLEEYSTLVVEGLRYPKGSYEYDRYLELYYSFQA